ncbi:MAG: SOS response-associated peptidase [Hyphomicrobiales bacterium]|nr:SOS response-associated peptidase [Hyphomicrobiales bacterium]
MCGRYLLTATPEELAALFGYLDGEWFPPRYNIAPTQPITVVRMVGDARRFALVRWGLVPAWVEDPREFSVLINARAEGLADKPSFKGAFRYRRCLVPASGFYEWKGPRGSTRQPYLFRRRDGLPMAFAGLWETWLGRDGSEIDSACIVTAAANRVVAGVHTRMPVILEQADYDRWLDAANHPPSTIDSLLNPAPDDLLEASAVSTRVNSAGNDDAGVIEPVAPTLF